MAFMVADSVLTRWEECVDGYGSGYVTTCWFLRWTNKKIVGLELRMVRLAVGSCPRPHRRDSDIISHACSLFTRRQRRFSQERREQTIPKGVDKERKREKGHQQIPVVHKRVSTGQSARASQGYGGYWFGAPLTGNVPRGWLCAIRVVAGPLSAGVVQDR
ncbi:hypothetical protein FIBSPDRAFT_884607 [Athelia psychrophila]|uniref:Uncharacterized protein n=1 Tax=Athelia psychrophila TaxID=1759441 RepID=A0A166SXR7_9AGAM|nr:hypothetical protein FIBSPDRAFT_884607 [Fibularhizoctonia sp. CBS 109695]